MEFRHRIKRQKQTGASMIEYALVVAGVAVIAYLLFGNGTDGVVGSAIENKFDSAINSVTVH